MLCWFADYFSILQCCLTFNVAHWLRWALSSTICPISGSSLSPNHCLPFFLSKLCLLKVLTVISFLILLPCAVHSEHPTHSAAYSFSVPCLLFSFFFLQGGGSVCSVASSGLSQGWLWEYCVPLICSPVGLLNVSQAGLEPVSGGAEALLFSHCNVAWRSFVWAGESGCQSFDSSWCFSSAMCGSSFSAKFLIYGTYATSAL
jgi:hypothetical protein